MNDNEMNRTEWHDSQGSAVEMNDPDALAENAEGKWHRVKGWSSTETTINGKKVTTGLNYFNGYQMGMHAEAKTTKGESTAIWLGLIAGGIIGVLTSRVKNPVIGIFLGVSIVINTFLTVAFKALMREDPVNNKKIVIAISTIFLGVFILAGIIVLILSHVLGL